MTELEERLTKRNELLAFENACLKDYNDWLNTNYTWLFGQLRQKEADVDRFSRRWLFAMRGQKFLPEEITPPS